MHTCASPTRAVTDEICLVALTLTELTFFRENALNSTVNLLDGHEDAVPKRAGNFALQVEIAGPARRKIGRMLGCIVLSGRLSRLAQSHASPRVPLSRGEFRLLPFILNTPVMHNTTRVSRAQRRIVAFSNPRVSSYVSD